ncbi:Peroxidase, family 2, partial [Rhizoctonia solani]
MRSTFFTVSLVLVATSAAFPTSSGTGGSGCPFASSGSHTKRQSVTGFDPVKQRIDVSGEHEFRPPGPNDRRGPCAGLNALANHGFIPRSGVATLEQIVYASNDVFGMGTDAATIFTVQGIAHGGDITHQTMSIGGPDPPPGLSGTHNQMEGDASPTRGDAYTNGGDSINLNMMHFKKLYNLIPEGKGASFDMEVMAKHRGWTRENSISTNPHYFTSPFAGLFVSTLTHFLSPALLSNHSAERPDGFLDHGVLKTFYGVTGDGDDLSYQPGQERIPENWYRRPDDYGLFTHIFPDMAKVAVGYPQFFSFGGNQMGKPNSFAGANLDDLTGGVYNAKNLLEGNNLFCFALQASQAGMVGPASNFFNKNISPIISLMGCPVMKQYNTSALAMYPGA